MKRLLAILALASVFVIHPCSLMASSQVVDPFLPAAGSPGADQPEQGDGTGDADDGVFEVQGDPDELGGGFRNAAKPPMNSNKVGPGGRDVVDSLVRLVLRLL